MAGVVDGVFFQYISKNGRWQLMLELAAIPSVHLPESLWWLGSKGSIQDLQEMAEEGLKELQEISGSVPQPQQ
jgi:hypothetical protein